MNEMMKPHEVRLGLRQIFGKESNEKAWPMIAGIEAKDISEKYEADYHRCIEISNMIRADLAQTENDND